MDVYCPPEAAVLLASYAVQAKVSTPPSEAVHPQYGRLLSTRGCSPASLLRRPGQGQYTSKWSSPSMDVYCPPEAAVLLASYAVQAKVSTPPSEAVHPQHGRLLSTRGCSPARLLRCPGQGQYTSKWSSPSMDVYCPPEAAVLLASYAVQAKVSTPPSEAVHPWTSTVHPRLRYC